MSRYSYTGVARSGSGKVIQGASAALYLTGTDTLATFYDSATGSAVTSVTSDDAGQFVLWVSDTDYYTDQQFRVKVQYPGGMFSTNVMDNVRIIPIWVGPNTYFPDATATDQGLTGDSNTIKYYVDLADGDNATIVLRHSSTGATTTYTIGTNETAPSNITLEFERGAVLSIATGVTLTIYSPANIQAASNKQIFDGDVDFSTGGIVHTEWWGAIADDSTDCLSAFNSANDSLPSGGHIKLDYGTYILSDTFEISDRVKVSGINSSTTFIKAQDGTTIIGGLVTNKIKTGQEYFYIDDLNINGNKNSASVDALIYLENVYVNSHLKNLVLRESSGHCLWFKRSAGFGPIYTENCWLATSNDHLLYVQGGTGLVFSGCTFENVAANKNCVHLTGSTTGFRSHATFIQPHFEFSNTGVNGVYADKASVTLIQPEFQGSQQADQYNVYFEDGDALEAVDYFIVNPLQAPTIRHGIYIESIDTEYTGNYGETGVLTSGYGRFTPGLGLLSLGSFEAGGDNVFMDGDTTPSVEGGSIFRTGNTSATTITHFDGFRDGQIFIVFIGDDETTIDANVTYLNMSGTYMNTKAGDILVFIGKGTVAWEISRSSNDDYSYLTISDNSATPSLNGYVTAIVKNTSATNITRFLRHPTSDKTVKLLFTTANTTLVHGTYIKLSGGVNYNPPNSTAMSFVTVGTVLYEISRTEHQ